MNTSTALDTEPFRYPTEHVFQGSVSELREFTDGNNYLLRVEPIDEHEDYAAFNRVLADFEKYSGLKVVPHWEVVGQAKYNDHNSLTMDKPESGEYKAVFHVTQRVLGEQVYEGYELANPAIPKEEAARLVTGLMLYFNHAYENKLPSSYELRPSQFMYGTTEGEETPCLYMVDLDSAHNEQVNISDVIENVWQCIEYLKSYPPDPIFRKSAKEMLRTIRSQEAQEWGGKGLSRARLESLELDILDYLDILDHL